LSRRQPQGQQNETIFSRRLFAVVKKPHGQGSPPHGTAEAFVFRRRGFLLPAACKEAARPDVGGPFLLIKTCVADLSQLSKKRLAMTSLGELFIQKSEFRH
jgi:hypothetical protein